MAAIFTFDPSSIESLANLDVYVTYIDGELEMPST